MEQAVCSSHSMFTTAQTGVCYKPATATYSSESMEEIKNGGFKRGQVNCSVISQQTRKDKLNGISHSIFPYWSFLSNRPSATQLLSQEWLLAKKSRPTYTTPFFSSAFISFFMCCHFFFFSTMKASNSSLGFVKYSWKNNKNFKEKNITQYSNLKKMFLFVTRM